MSYLPYFDVDELQALFGYKHKVSVYNAIKRGTFPVPTYKIRGSIVADREVVRRYFELKREAGLEALNRRFSVQDETE